MRHEYTENGNLRFFKDDPGDDEYLADLLEKSKGNDLSAIAELIDDMGMLGNGWGYLHPEQIGALTEAPLLGFDVQTDDDGEVTEVAEIYWFPNYQVANWLEELIEHGEVLFMRSRP